jgi:hypothetical protein
MSWTGNHICNSFRKELLEGRHDFTAAGHIFKLALYDADATLNAETTDYSVTNEVSGAGYLEGGLQINTVNPTLVNGVAVVDFADVLFPAVTIAARGALIYNTTTAPAQDTTNAIMVLDFGRVITRTAADLLIVMPTPDQINALLRL